jgi:hypothetical protein
MDFVTVGNIIEGIFWIALSLFFLAPACRRKEKHRLFCLTGGVILILFGGSDFYEAHTGAWWKPWWLLLWKIGCVSGFGLIIWWYVRIHGSIKEALENLKRPLFSKSREKQGR